MLNTLADAPQLVGDIRTSLQDAWVCIGMTGSGKTTFSKQLFGELTRLYPGTRRYILDSKGHDDFLDIKGVFERSQKAPRPLDRPGTLIWSPPLDDLDQYDEWFQSILRAGKPAVVLIDELANISRGNGRVTPDGFKLLLKQGRSIGISRIVSTQEAAYVPRQTLSQVNHLIRFRLLDDYDARRSNKLLMRNPDEPEPLDKFGFYYRRVDSSEQPEYYRGWQDFFRS